jgi:hypothetical protein
MTSPLARGVVHVIGLINECGAVVEWWLAGENRKRNRRKPGSSAASSATNLACSQSGLNPGLMLQKSAANHQNYGPSVYWTTCHTFRTETNVGLGSQVSISWFAWRDRGKPWRTIVTVELRILWETKWALVAVVVRVAFLPLVRRAPSGE